MKLLHFERKFHQLVNVGFFSNEFQSSWSVKSEYLDVFECSYWKCR